MKYYALYSFQPLKHQNKALAQQSYTPGWQVGFGPRAVCADPDKDAHLCFWNDRLDLPGGSIPSCMDEKHPSLGKQLLPQY